LEEADFSHIGEEILEINKQSSGELSKQLRKPVVTSELVEDLYVA
jgi:hypothetical protein